MINTYTSYQMLTRDLARSLDRVAQQPIVERDTEYYLANIGQVTSIDEFMEDTRLYNYAMKAHGLEDMIFAKAFIRKALEEGIDDPDAFANRLNDKRYAELVRSFNFAALGEQTTTFNRANQGTTGFFTIRFMVPGEPLPEAVQVETEYFANNIGHIKTIDDFLHEDNERLLAYAMAAYELEGHFADKDLIRSMLEGGTADAESPANTAENTKWKDFTRAFDFAGLGEDATTYNPALKPSVDMYLRQTLEENAGEQNEGVRLALYFMRKAPEIRNAYQLLGDPALGKVIRTLMQLPDSIAQLDVDKQAKLIEDRFNLADFQDPAILEKLTTRFTTLWEVQNPSTPTQSLIVGLFQPVEFGISQDTLMAIASMKR